MWRTFAGHVISEATSPYQPTVSDTAGNDVLVFYDVFYSDPGRVNVCAAGAGRSRHAQMLKDGRRGN